MRHENQVYNLTHAKKYYDAVLRQDFETVSDCLHDDIILLSPLAEVIGKDAVVQAAKNLSQVLTNITIRAEFSSQNQVMFAYDFHFAEPIGILRSAGLITFEALLIKKIELFYDGRPFEQKKEKIFTQASS